jgi:ribosome biogenesis protein UTP30
LKISEKNLSLNPTQVTKAIKCIKEIISKRYENTLNILSCEDEELIYMNFVLGKLPLKYSLRPVSIPLEKTMHNLDNNTRICLFVKDPKKDFKELNIDFPINVKVIDVQSLKLKYSRFQERRNLLKQYDLFLCDYKIYFVLKKLLGKPFYVNKKYPVPIKLNYEDKEQIKTEVINHVNNSGVFYMTNGPNYAFKVARFNMDKDDILRNVMKSVNVVIAHIMKWGVSFEE